MEPRTDQQSGRRGILIVDGDAQVRRLLELSLRNAGFDVQTVATAPEALTAIGQHRPDLIVSETRLEGGPDGFELCRQIKKRVDGAIPFMLLAEQSVEAKLRGVEAGADDFLAKPVYVQEVVAHARSLLQRRERDRLEALARGDERFVGAVEDFPLVDLLGALEANHKSGVVVIAAAGGARGELYFRDGAVVDAEVGRLSGLDAVCRLFSWAEGRFEIEWKSIRRRDAVGREPGALLMEALHRLDEWRRLLAELPALDTIFEVDYHLLAERLAEIPDEVNGVLRLFDGQRMFIHVIDDSGLSDLDALAVIGKLYREEIIRDVRARPESHASAGADIEGWLTEAAGPFRAPPQLPKRELFGASLEPSAGVHGRATAPVEPLEEAGREPVVAERRERFTDRLIAEGAPQPPAATRAPAMAPETTQLGLPTAPPQMAVSSLERTQLGLPSAPPVTTALSAETRLGLPAAPAQMAVSLLETTQLGLPAAPAPPRLPAIASETTQQGLGSPAPTLSTKPGFAVVTSPLPRVARELPTDVTPASRATPIGLPTDGVPQPLAPQSPEPAIVVPPTTTAIALPPVEAQPAEQKPVFGEIVSRSPPAKLVEPAKATSLEAPPKRTTDLGLGHERPGSNKDARALAPTAKAGEVVAGPAKPEEARPVRKIILDPEIPEDDDEPHRGSRWVKPLGLAIGIVLAVVAVWGVLKSTGHKRPADAPVIAAAPAEKPIVTPLPSAAPEAGVAVSVDAGTSVASAHDAAAGAPPLALDERTADPKLARALPTEFPQLLSACRQAFTEKRAKDAESACTAATDANPSSAEACALLGHALFNRKKRREALQWAERAVALDASAADAYVIIGGVKQADNDLAAAKAAYKKYLELSPNGQYAADLRVIVDSP